jgi:predicted transposase YbfD/YdcC
MGCQRSFARQITDQGGDYLLAVKDNQPTLLEAIKTEFIDKIVLNLLRLDTTDQTNCSLRMKRKRAAWDDDIRAKILGLTRR